MRFTYVREKYIMLRLALRGSVNGGVTDVGGRRSGGCVIVSNGVEADMRWRK